MRIGPSGSPRMPGRLGRTDDLVGAHAVLEGKAPADIERPVHEFLAFQQIGLHPALLGDVLDDDVDAAILPSRLEERHPVFDPGVLHLRVRQA